MQKPETRLRGRRRFNPPQSVEARLKLHLWRGIRGVVYAAIGVMVGALIASAFFVLGRRETSGEELLARASEQTLAVVRSQRAIDLPPTIDRILSYSLDMAGRPTLVVIGPVEQFTLGASGSNGDGVGGKKRVK